jgi:O-antigen/teichoic acid export membrane protein
MTAEQVAGIVRAIVAAIGGYLVGKGFADAETVAAVGGAVATIAAAVWSVLSKRKGEPQA